MATLRIEGGRRLSGRVAVEGNKNSALPLIAACLLTDQPCEISNVPRIRDVGVLLEILSGLGANVEGAGTSTLRITCARITTDRPDPELVGRLRGSVLLLGPLLSLPQANPSAAILTNQRFMRPPSTWAPRGTALRRPGSCRIAQQSRLVESAARELERAGQPAATP